MQRNEPLVFGAIVRKCMYGEKLQEILTTTLIMLAGTHSIIAFPFQMWTVTSWKKSGSESFTRWLTSWEARSRSLGARGSKASPPGGKGHVILCFRIPTTSESNSGYMSPLPASMIPTPSAFTEQQKAFIGPHHGPKFWGKNRKSTTKVTLRSDQ